MRFVVFPRDLDIDRWRHKSHRHVIQHRKSRVVCWYRQVCSFRSACSSQRSSFLHTRVLLLAALDLRRDRHFDVSCDVPWLRSSTTTWLHSTSLQCYMNWWCWLKVAHQIVKFSAPAFKSGKTCLWLTDWLSKVLRKMNHGVWTAHNDWVNGNYLSSSSRWWLSWR